MIALSVAKTPSSGMWVLGDFKCQSVIIKVFFFFDFLMGNNERLIQA